MIAILRQRRRGRYCNDQAVELEKILAFVHESGRFQVGWLLMTVV